MMQELGDYEILDVIGAGQSATVHRARRRDDDTLVAIKVFDRQAEFRHQQRAFQKEVEAINSLDGVKNVVTILDSGTTDDGDPYLVMPLYVGSAQHLLNDGATLPWIEAVGIASSISRAVDEAHRRGIVHLDIKPANILMDADGEPHLSDFGISAMLEATLTGTTSIAFTPQYVAPERLQGSRDESCDVYSLGASCLALLGPEAAAGTTGPQGPPPELLSVLQSATSQVPGFRPPSASSFAEALDLCVSNPSDVAALTKSWRPSLGQRMRRKAPLILAGIVAVIAIVAIVLSLGGDAPAVRLEPATGDQATSFRVVAENFSADVATSAQVELPDGTVIDVEDLSTNSLGVYSTSADRYWWRWEPDEPFGTYTLTLTDPETGKSASGEFTVEQSAPSVRLVPDVGGAGTPLRLQVFGFDGGSSVDLAVTYPDGTVVTPAPVEVADGGYFLTPPDLGWWFWEEGEAFGTYTIEAASPDGEPTVSSQFRILPPAGLDDPVAQLEVRGSNPLPTSLWQNPVGDIQIGEIAPGSELDVICQLQTGVIGDGWWIQIGAGDAWPAGWVVRSDVRDAETAGLPDC